MEQSEGSLFEKDPKTSYELFGLDSTLDVSGWFVVTRRSGRRRAGSIVLSCWRISNKKLNKHENTNASSKHSMINNGQDSPNQI